MYLFLLLGLLGIIGAIVDFVRQGRIPNVPMLFISVAITVLSLAGLLGLMTERWVLALIVALSGLFFVVIGIGTLRAPGNPSKWASWAALVIGIGAIVMTFVLILVPPPQ